MRGPLSPTDGGVLLAIEVVPGASRNEFPAGYNPWRARVQARVSAPPEDGRANLALCALVAAHFGLRSADVEVAQGATDRRKTLLLRGLTAERVRERLAGVLP